MGETFPTGRDEGSGIEQTGGRGSARWSPDGERIYVAGAGTNGAIMTPCAIEKLRPHLDRCKDKTDNESCLPAGPGQRAGFGVWSGDGKDIVTSTFFEGQPSVWNASAGRSTLTWRTSWQPA